MSKHKIDVKRILWLLLLATVGSSLMSAGMAIFTIPNNIAPGGIGGLATSLAKVIPLPVGTITLSINCMILICAFFVFGWKTVLITFYTSLCYSFTINHFSEVLPHYTQIKIIAAIMGGIMIGTGLGILFLEKISTGGTDLIALMLGKAFPKLKKGTLLIILDAFVVLVAVIIFKDIMVAVYSAVTVFVLGKVIDLIQYLIEKKIKQERNKKLGEIT